jgi:hypothetical protein
MNHEGTIYVFKDGLFFGIFRASTALHTLIEHASDLSSVGYEWLITPNEDRLNVIARSANSDGLEAVLGKALALIESGPQKRLIEDTRYDSVQQWDYVSRRGIGVFYQHNSEKTDDIDWTVKDFE